MEIAFCCQRNSTSHSRPNGSGPKSGGNSPSSTPHRIAKAAAKTRVKQGHGRDSVACVGPGEWLPAPRPRLTARLRGQASVERRVRPETQGPLLSKRARVRAVWGLKVRCPVPYRARECCSPGAGAPLRAGGMRITLSDRPALAATPGCGMGATDTPKWRMTRSWAVCGSITAGRPAARGRRRTGATISVCAGGNWCAIVGRRGQWPFQAPPCRQVRRVLRG